MFILWVAITLFRTPFWKCARTSRGVVQTCCVRPSRWKSLALLHRSLSPDTSPRFVGSLLNFIARFPFFIVSGFSRSYTCSM